MASSASSSRPQFDRPDHVVATELLIEMLRRSDAGGTWQLDVIQELHLFGSYARGAPEPGDVDVIVEFDHHRPEWKQHTVR